MTACAADSSLPEDSRERDMQWVDINGWARKIVVTLGLTVLAGSAQMAAAERIYGPGVSDTDIKIGNTMPYSGPNANVSSIGRTEAAYFEMLNERGGVNGRKVTFISLDDAYSPPKTLEQVRKLVEQEHVFGSLLKLGNEFDQFRRDPLLIRRHALFRLGSVTSRWAFRRCEQFRSLEHHKFPRPERRRVASETPPSRGRVAVARPPWSPMKRRERACVLRGGVVWA